MIMIMKKQNKTGRLEFTETVSHNLILMEKVPKPFCYNTCSSYFPLCNMLAYNYFQVYLQIFNIGQTAKLLSYLPLGPNL